MDNTVAGGITRVILLWRLRCSTIGGSMWPVTDRECVQLAAQLLTIIIPIGPLYVRLQGYWQRPIQEEALGNAKRRGGTSRAGVQMGAFLPDSSHTHRPLRSASGKQLSSNNSSCDIWPHNVMPLKTVSVPYQSHRIIFVSVYFVGDRPSATRIRVFASLIVSQIILCNRVWTGYVSFLCSTAACVLTLYMYRYFLCLRSRSVCGEEPGRAWQERCVSCPVLDSIEFVILVTVSSSFAEVSEQAV